MGAINIKHTGSGADIALSSDGTSLLLDGTAIGGGGAALELYAENPVTPTAPSATGDNAVAIGSGATATGNQSFSFGHGSDATALRALAVGGDNIANIQYAAAFGFGANSTGDSATSIGRSASASGSSSVALGYLARATAQFGVGIGYNSDALSTGSLAAGFNAQTATGSNATALTNSYASGADSFAAAIANNTSSYGATGASSVAIGYQAKANIGYGTAIGGVGNIAGSYATAIGGTYNSATGAASFAIGEYTSAAQRGKIAFGASQSGVLQQGGILVLRSFTSDATPTALYAGGSTVGANQIILPNNSAYSFSGTIIARQSAAAGSDYASWEVKGALLRDANAASTVLGNGIVNKLFATAGAAAWDIALTADTTNGGLAITVTGAAATSIRWVATISTSEVTYA